MSGAFKRVISAVTMAWAVGYGAVGLGATVSIGEGAVNGDRLTIPVTLSEPSSVDIYIGIAGPRDGDPTLRQTLAQTFDLAAGSNQVEVQVPVGAKVAYSARTAESSSEVKTVTLTDSSEYVWVNNAVGSWHEPTNWVRVATATDGYRNMGYPAYSKGFVRFNGNQTAVVEVDASYTGLGDLFIDNPNLNLTIRSNGKTLEFGNTHTTRDNTVLLDQVRVITRGAYTVGHNSTTRLINGAYLQTNWELNVNGTNAKLYVGPLCEVYASSGWWWSLRLDGEGALIEIEDGYIHGRAFRLASQRTDQTPTGVIFKGTSPRLELEEEFVGCSENLPGVVTFEYYVPVGGYAQAPFRKMRGGNFRALDNAWQDHTGSSTVYNTPVRFCVSKYSPFYQEEVATEVCLFDWSATEQGVKESQISLATTETPDTDYLVKRAASGSGEANQVWAHLTGKGIPADLPTISSETSAVIDAETGKVTLSGAVTKLADGLQTLVEVYLAEGGPVDEPLEQKLQLVTTLEIDQVGAFSYLFDGTKGAKVAYQFVCIAQNETSERRWESGTTAVQSIIYRDDAKRRYEWRNGATGNWSDSANWTLSGADDGLKYLGYPSWGSNIGIYSGKNTIIVDADYADIREMILGWSGSEITFVSAAKDETSGAVEKVYTVEVASFRDGQYNNTHVTLDGVAFDTLGKTYPNSYHVWQNSSLRLYNGARLRTKWEMVAEGANATVYVGTNCSIRVSRAEPYHRLGLGGQNAQITIDGGTIEAIYLRIRSGDTPKGIVFSGSNPQLLLNDSMGSSRASYIEEGLADSPTFTFVVPEEGFTSTPIVRTAQDIAPTTFFAKRSPTAPNLILAIDKASPYLNCHQAARDVALVEWTSRIESGNQPLIDTTGITFAPAPAGNRTQLYYTPAESTIKSGISARCYGKSGCLIILQ